jgi:hypothetical protein
MRVNARLVLAVAVEMISLMFWRSQLWRRCLPWRIRAAAKVVGLDGLDKLRMRWAGWALKWHLFYSFSFLFFNFSC